MSLKFLPLPKLSHCKKKFITSRNGAFWLFHVFLLWCNINSFRGIYCLFSSTRFFIQTLHMTDVELHVKSVNHISNTWLDIRYTFCFNVLDTFAKSLVSFSNVDHLLELIFLRSTYSHVNHHMCSRHRYAVSFFSQCRGYRNNKLSVT